MRPTMPRHDMMHSNRTMIYRLSGQGIQCQTTGFGIRNRAGMSARRVGNPSHNHNAHQRRTYKLPHRHFSRSQGNTSI